MDKKSKEGDPFLVLAAAYLKQKGTNLQVDIAHELGKSQSLVSQLLTEAKEKGWMETRTVLTKDAPKDILLQVKARYDLKPKLDAAIARRYPDSGCTVWICDGSGGSEFDGASEFLIQILQDAKRVGVAWGRTLAALIERIPENPRDSLLEDFQCIPMSGEPIYLTHHEVDRKYQSTALALNLQRRLTGEAGAVPVLDAVPAYIPSTLVSKGMHVRTFIESIPGYQKVFGGSSSAIWEVDTMLTGVGLVTDEDDGMGTFVRERIHQEEILSDELQRLAIGDLAGLLIENEDLAAKDAKRLKTLNQCFVGLELDHIQACVERARRNGSPGVIAIGMHPVQKAPLIRTVVERGLCNQIIVSRRIAEELVRLWGDETVSQC